MMADYMISCCSTVDLTAQHLAERRIACVFFHYQMDGVEYLDDLGQSISFPDFYKKMEQEAMTKTSQVNAEEYAAHFRKYLEAGQDVIHVCLSSGISGTINSALIAKAQMEEAFPERKIYVIDSLAASSGYGLLMNTMADRRDAGMDIDTLRDWVEQNKLHLHHWFFSMDLTFYVRGGRITAAAGWFGTILNLCPLLNVNNEGRLIPRSKLRGKKRAIKAAFDRMVEHAEGGLAYADQCYISQSACYEDAKTLADMIEEAFPNLKEKVLINYIGTTIGSHTGPGTVALFFWGDERGE